jgi:hypothetical protein
MNHESPRRPSPITLEQLLRLKRAERPPAEFWAEFDRAMRTKQLAAIVEPRPWWAPFIRVGSRVARYQLPVGATAVLALSVFTVSQYQPPVGESVYVPTLAQSVQQTAETVPTVSEVPAEVANLRADAVLAKAEPAPLPVDSPARTVAESPARTGEPSISQLVSMVSGARSLGVMNSELSPSARSIAANLAAVKASEPELARWIEQGPGFETRALAAQNAPVEPLTQVSSSGDSTRVRRLLASALPASLSSSETANRTPARLGRGLSDDRLYERVSRFDVESERLAINIKL